MSHNPHPAFLDQTIGRLVYAIIPVNIFLTIAYGATSWETHSRRALWLCISSLVLLVVFWAISTVRLIALRPRKNRWRLIAFTPPTAILVAESYALDGSIAFLGMAFLVWLLASLSVAFMPIEIRGQAVENQ
jgi:hypothetical protein